MLASAPNALALSESAKVPAGYEIIPSHEAQALVAYLASLRVEEPLFVAPLTAPPPPPTNAPAGATNAPAAGTTNATVAPTNPAPALSASTNAAATNAASSGRRSGSRK